MTKEIYVTDSEDPNLCVREGFNDCAIDAIFNAENGDTVSVARYKDALTLRAIRNVVKSKLNVSVIVRASEQNKPFPL